MNQKLTLDHVHFKDYAYDSREKVLAGSNSQIPITRSSINDCQINHLTLINLINGCHGRTGLHKGHAELDLLELSHDETAEENERGAYRLGPACLASRNLQTMVIFCNQLA